jgi:nucleoside-diphosphate-sugar epimerase
MNHIDSFIASQDELILVTGASGFIGAKLVENLLQRGLRNLRCFVRPSSDMAGIQALRARFGNGPRIDVVKGNLASKEDCAVAAKDVAVIYHLAAGRGEKSFPDAFFNSVVTTRNLLDAFLRHGILRRFVNVSSFTVYSNRHKPHGRLLDELCPLEEHPELRADAYGFAKIKQEEIVLDYGKKFGVPYVFVRPGYVYGPGNEGITGRVGLGTFGLFLHLGGSNTVPLSYVDNCVEAIALAGLTHGVEGEVFNVVDDELPSSRKFLRQYKKNVKSLKSIYVPHAFSYVLCYLWEKYSAWSEVQLPPAYNLREWHISWKKTRYTNQKIKERLGWTQIVPTSEGLRRFFDACRTRGQNA